MNLAEAAKAQRKAQEKAAIKQAEAERLAEFRAKEMELIGDLPWQFRDLVSGLAWEYGHAAGYHEVLTYASDIGDKVRRALRDYSAAYPHKTL